MKAGQQQPSPCKPQQQHPLDPLTADEVITAANAVRQHASLLEGLPPVRFNTITLQEPPKAALVAYCLRWYASQAMGGAEERSTSPPPSPLPPPPPRMALCILQFPPNPMVVEAEVDLGSGGKPLGRVVVKSWKELHGVQPVASPDDCLDAERIAKQDERVVALLKERGLEDMCLVAGDPWSVHLAPCEGRLVQLFMYARSSADDNHYAHPIDFVPVVDLNLGKVVHIDLPYGKGSGSVPPPEVPAQDCNYHRSLLPLARPWRASPPSPLNVVQPEGPSFKVEGRLVRWQNWQLRVGFNYREGLVLHDVRYNDGGKLRPVMWRASLAEMAVPYADPNSPFTRKCAFDVGDYGLGNCCVDLELGCDCLGAIHYFDAVLNNSKGEPVRIPHAVCLHEEDAGLLWKHVEYRNGHSEARRSRRMVLSFVATVVNYEYAIYWYFYQDGTISMDIKLTGELSTNLPSPGEDPACPQYGTLILPRVNAQLHQHMFAARLDLAVDDQQGGKGLAVTEVNVEALPEGAPGNPEGNAFVAVESELTRESHAARVADASSGRYWKVKNPGSKNPVTGQPVAYKLVGPANPTLLAQPSSLVAKKGAFATKNLWVTPHSDKERWPAGDYPMQHKGGAGLPAWTKEDRPIGPGTDPVVWHCFGVTHIPRVEDFPVMPVESVGFSLKPVNFFSSNPSVDLPPDVNKASKLCTNGGGPCSSISCGASPAASKPTFAKTGAVHSRRGAF